MSHKKRITIEVDPQIATIALGMTRVMLHMKESGLFEALQLS